MTRRVPTTPTNQATESGYEVCECGHTRDRHWMGFGAPGTCMVNGDKRHPSGGGDTLWPCPCKGFVPMDRLRSSA